MQGWYDSRRDGKNRQEIATSDPGNLLNNAAVGQRDHGQHDQAGVEHAANVALPTAAGGMPTPHSDGVNGGKEAPVAPRSPPHEPQRAGRANLPIDGNEARPLWSMPLHLAPRQNSEAAGSSESGPSITVETGDTGSAINDSEAVSMQQSEFSNAQRVPDSDEDEPLASDVTDELVRSVFRPLLREITSFGPSAAAVAGGGESMGSVMLVGAAGRPGVCTTACFSSRRPEANHARAVASACAKLRRHLLASSDTTSGLDSGGQVAFRTAGGTSVAVSALRAFMGERAVMRETCGLIAEASASPRTARQVAREGGVVVLLQALSALPEDPAVVSEALAALAHVLSTGIEGACAEFRVQNGYPVVVAALQANASRFRPSGSVNIRACDLLAEAVGDTAGASVALPVIARPSSLNHANAAAENRMVLAVTESIAGRSELDHVGVFPVLVKVLASRASNHDEVAAACRALQTIMGNPTRERQASFVACGAMDQMTAIMRRRRQDDSLVATCLDTVLWAFRGEKELLPLPATMRQDVEQGPFTEADDNVGASESSRLIRASVTAVTTAPTASGITPFYYAQLAFLAAQGLESTVRVLGALAGNAQVVQLAAHVIAQLAERGDVIGRYVFWRETGLRVLLVAMGVHNGTSESAAPDIADHFCSALASLSGNAFNALGIGELGGVEALAETMRAYGEALLSVFVSACVAAAAAANNNSTCRLFASAGGIPWLLRGLRVHIRSRPAVICAMRVLSTVMRGCGSSADLGGGGDAGRGMQAALLELGIAELLMSTLQLHAQESTAGDASTPTSASAVVTQPMPTGTQASSLRLRSSQPPLSQNDVIAGVCHVIVCLGHCNDSVRSAFVEAGLLRAVVSLIVRSVDAIRENAAQRCSSSSRMRSIAVGPHSVAHLPPSTTPTLAALLQCAACLTARGSGEEPLPTTAAAAAQSDVLAAGGGLDAVGNVIACFVPIPDRSAGRPTPAGSARSHSHASAAADADVTREIVSAGFSTLANVSCGNLRARALLLAMGDAWHPETPATTPTAAVAAAETTTLPPLPPRDSIMGLVAATMDRHRHDATIVKYAICLLTQLQPQPVASAALDACAERQMAASNIVRSLLQTLEEYCQAQGAGAVGPACGAGCGAGPHATLVLLPALEALRCALEHATAATAATSTSAGSGGGAGSTAGGAAIAQFRDAEGPRGVLAVLRRHLSAVAPRERSLPLLACACAIINTAAADAPMLSSLRSGNAAKVLKRMLRAYPVPAGGAGDPVRELRFHAQSALQRLGAAR